VKRAADEAVAAAEEEEEAAEEEEEEAEEEDNEWRTEGHKWLGQRVRRFHETGYTDGTLTRWMPADGDEAPIWRMLHDDDDEEDLEAYEVERALHALKKNLTDDPNPDGEEEEPYAHEKPKQREARCKAANICSFKDACVLSYAHDGPCQIGLRRRLSGSCPATAASSDAHGQVDGDADADAYASEMLPGESFEASCQRRDQCMKNALCKRGFKHGPGRCRIKG